MAANTLRNASKPINPIVLLRKFVTQRRHYNGVAAASSSPFTFSSDERSDSSGSGKDENSIYVKAPKKDTAASVTMPMSFMTGSIVGKRFYKQVTTRLADDGNGWTVMLDYKTLKTPSKRPLKLPTHSLAKAIAAEWEYQQTDGIRPFTMPLMKLACTALERVPLTRMKIIDNLVSKFNQDLVFCRAPWDNDLTSSVYARNNQHPGPTTAAGMAAGSGQLFSTLWEINVKDKKIQDRQVEKLDPLLGWVNSEFGFKPVVYSSFFGGKQDPGLVKAIEDLLMKTDGCELAAIDAMTAASHSLIISIALFRGKLQIEEAIELIRLEEDLQIDRWGLVEGGHDIDVADLKVQISSAVVFLGLTRKS